MIEWKLAGLLLGLVFGLAGVLIHRCAYVRGFREGEQVGAQAIATHFGVTLKVSPKGTYKDTGPARYYDELEEHNETGGVVRPLKDYGHGKQ